MKKTEQEALKAALRKAVKFDTPFHALKSFINEVSKKGEIGGTDLLILFGLIGQTIASIGESAEYPHLLLDEIANLLFEYHTQYKS